MSDQEIASELKALEAARSPDPSTGPSWIGKVLIAAAVFALALIISDFAADKTVDPAKGSMPKTEGSRVVDRARAVNPQGYPVQFVRAAPPPNEMPPQIPPSPR